MADQPSSWIEVSRSASRSSVEDHALVLDALGIPNGIVQEAGEHVVVVRLDDAVRARAELSRFVRENQDRPTAGEPATPIGVGLFSAALYVLVLVAIDAAVRNGLLGEMGWREGVADAAMIRAGEWWRGITSLTLHADALHLAGNLVFGSAFGVMLAQSIGYGAAWLAFVVTGAAGNWLNAWAQQPSHTSIGASTAIFGMLGVQIAHDGVARRWVHQNPFRRWAPFAIGAALLAWIGGGEHPIDPPSWSVPVPKIDVGAHVLGFACGVALGGLLGWSKLRFVERPRLQPVWAVAAATIVGAAWFLALR